MYTTSTPDPIAEQAWNKLGVQLAAMVGLDLFQYALELDNHGPVWLDSTWILTDLMVNKQDRG